MNGKKMGLAYGALVLAMMISAGSFFFGNLAVKEIPPWPLAFWTRFIAALSILPFVLKAHGNPIRYFRRHRLHAIVVSFCGVVLATAFFYLAVSSDDLINVSAGYTAIPLLTVLFSALLLGERLRPVQFLGVGLAFLGALVFAFQGSITALMNFDPHAAFLWMIAFTAARGLYLVLLKKWDLHPGPDEGLFVLVFLGLLMLLPALVAPGAGGPHPLDYSWQAWFSILYVGVGMGAAYLYFLSYGSEQTGASRASLFAYLVPVFVALASVVFLGASLHIYQAVGAVLIVAGVLIVTRAHQRALHSNDPPH